MKKILFGFLALFSVLFVACAPGSSGLSIALARFPIKASEQWQLSSFKPGNPEAQTFPLELYDEPELDEEGILGVAAEAGKFESEIYYNPQENLLLIFVLLTRGNDPEIALCIMGNAIAGKTSFKGTSFYGKASELRDLDKLPRERFATCELSKK